MRNKLMLGFVVLAFCCHARTVALWPLERDDVLGTANVRCAIDNANAFVNAMEIGATVKAVEWNLPPNPDSAAHLFQPINKAYFSNSGSSTLLTCVNPDIGRVLALTNDFTLEGWIAPVNVQDGNWHVIAQGNNGSDEGLGWIWSIRNTRTNANDPSVKDVTFEMYTARVPVGGVGENDQIFGEPISPVEAVDLTNRWHHVALVFVHENGNGMHEWRMYYDGTLKGSIEVGARTSYPTSTNATLNIGGRPSGKSLLGGYDYWRLSDAALGPSDFLCAGGIGTRLASTGPTTVSYWKLDCSPSGTLDTSDCAGHAHLNMGLIETPDNLYSKVTASTDAAFSGNPPNPYAMLAGGNVGSARMDVLNANLRFPGLGAALETTNSFTVEGWVKFDDSFGTASTYQSDRPQRFSYIFHTRQDDDGWALQQTEQANGIRTFAIHAEDPASGRRLVTSQRPFAKKLRGDESGWIHLALVYDHAAGDSAQGVWTLYGNGECWGSITNEHVVTGPSCGSDFMIGGRGVSKDQFFGGFDSVRVSGAALNPTQFLCADTDMAEAASDVIAWWPLNSSDGVCLDVSDIVGPYSVNSGKYAATTYKPAAVVGDAPTIVNPDASGRCRTDTTSLGGSLQFGRGTNRYLLTQDPDVCGLFGGNKNYTLECYLKCNEVAANWEILSIALQGLNTTLTDPGCWLNFSYRLDGFKILDATARPLNSVGDVLFPESKDILGVNEWHHVALTHACTPDSSDGKTLLTLYVDGTRVSSLTGTMDVAQSVKAVSFFGRYYSQNSFRGQVSSMRLSNTVLAPSQFICGSQPVSCATNAFRKGTIAYWAFDNADGTADVADRAPFVSFVPDVADTALLTGIADAACRHVPNPDTNIVPRVATNVGAVAFPSGGGVLRVASVGLELEPMRPFTIEGWLKWTRTDPGVPEVLFGTYHESIDAGWRLYIDSTGGTPVLKLLAKAPGSWTAVTAATLVADVSHWDRDWVHLALTYDPAEGTNGRWRVYEFGKEVGSADNRWLDRCTTWGIHEFMFGAVADSGTVVGYTGLLDSWRISDGALRKDAFLWQPPHGLSIIIR